MTDRAAIRRALDEAILAYGGVDQVVVTAGYYPNPDEKGDVGDHEWARAFAINVTGRTSSPTRRIGSGRQQGLEGGLVITTSVNAVVPKAGSFAYDTSKAAANHLVRELAVAYASAGARERRRAGDGDRRVVDVPARAGARRRSRSTRSPHDPSASTEALRDQLAAFYAKRTLTGKPVTLDSQIRAITAFLNGDFSKTTGQIVNVDGGQAAAFLR